MGAIRLGLDGAPVSVVNASSVVPVLDRFGGFARGY